MNRKRLFILGLLCLALLALSLPIGFFVHAKSHSRSAPSAARPLDSSLAQARVTAEYGQLPLSFEENLGQSDARVKFMARGSGYTVFLTDDESTTFHLSAPSKDAENTRERGLHSLLAIAPEKCTEAVVHLALAGANRHAHVEGLELRPGKSNYFIGNDPTRWQRNISHYARVKYRGVYPGVDLIYYGHQGQLESDYVLAPGADPSRIGLRIDGARSVKLDSEGGLILATAAGDVVLHKPIAYQEIASGRQKIAVDYVQRGPHLVGLRVAPYDIGQPLIIDPSMIYSTYLGGSGQEFANGIVVDSTGNAYVTGFTTSTDFPTIPGSFQTAAKHTGSNQETFITKLSTDGSALVYSTYLGGTGSSAADQGAAIAVNANGEAFVTGTTGAADFPRTPNAYTQTTPNSSGMAYLTQLNNNGSALLYSTLLGGSTRETGLGLALDPAGNAYVVGATASLNFPITNSNAFQTSNNLTTSGAVTAFLSRIDTTKTGVPSLIYSTYLGGSGGETAQAVAVDSNGNAYITGQTASPDFPRPLPSPPAPAPFQPGLATGGAINAFIARIDTNKSGTASLIYSSYLGGSGTSSGGGDQGNGIALDGNKNAYIVGTTGSLDFPVTAGAFQTTNHNKGVGLLQRVAFVASFDTTKSAAASLIYSTYLGGSGSLGDAGLGIAVDSLKQAYVSGFTTSSDFPVTLGAPQANRQGLNAFVTVFNPTGTSPLVFSTFWGGAGREDGKSIALDSASPPNVYLAGRTTSTVAFATSTSAFQKSLKGLQDAFVTKFSAASAVGGVSVAPTSLAFGSQTVNTKSAAQTVTLTNGATTALTINSIVFSGANGSDFAEMDNCPISPATLAAGANCTLNVTFTPSTTAAESATLTIHDTNASGSLQQTVSLTGSGTASGTPDFTVSVSPASATVAAGTPAPFTVTVTSVGGFTGAVALTCSGAPAPCALTPSSVSPGANATATSMGSITTAKRTSAPPLLFRMPPSFPGWLCTLAGIVMAFLAVWMAARRTSSKLAFGFGLLALLSLTSCSGPIHGGTAAGTYTVTITASSGALQHPTHFVLTVQ